MGNEMNKLAVVVTSPPHSNLTNTAIKYIEAALQANINVIGVFFYQDGVLNASSQISIPSDEFQIITAWDKLAEVYKLPLHLCISAAQKRGLTDDETENANINPSFTVSGLGELVELSNQADRLIQF